MTYFDLWNNHSLMKLCNHKLETQDIQRIYSSPMYIESKEVSEQVLAIYMQNSKYQKFLISQHYFFQ